MELILIILLGFVGGWTVNVLADALPTAQPLRAVWAATGQALLPGPQPAHAWRRRVVLVAAALLGWVAFRQGGWSLQAAVLLLYAWFFLAVAVIDLEHRRVLNRMLGPTLPVMLGVSLWLGMPTLVSALLGALAGFGFFLLVALLRRGGMGMGDVKLAGVIGLATGLGGVLVALVVGILAGGVAALALLGITRFDRRATMAYAPYLVVGAWTALFWGQSLWAWYADSLQRLVA
jgi:prepilin signal peptidase PulO-like enzyme (type II secretory pathway)